MSVYADVTSVDIQNTGNQRGTVQVLAPVLVKNIWLRLSLHLEALPDSHPLLEMLLFNLPDSD